MKKWHILAFLIGWLFSLFFPPQNLLGVVKRVVPGA